MQSIAAMLRIAGIIAFVAIIGFSFTACGEEDDGGGGKGGGSILAAYRNTTWTKEGLTVAFGNTNTVTISGFNTTGGWETYNGTFTLESEEVPMMSNFDRRYNFHGKKIMVFVMNDGSAIALNYVTPDNSYQESVLGFTKQ